MTQATTHPPLELEAPPGEPVMRFRRFVKAPPELVWEAITKPEHLVNWWGPRDLELVVCDLDLRVGGSYRFVHRAPDGAEFGFRGTYREIDPPRTLTQTFVYDGAPEHESVETMTLEPVEGGTMVLGVSVHDTVEGRDLHLENGMEDGARQTYERLDDLLATLTSGGTS